ncbi:MAG: recombinase family protein [Clostridia bacterium]|nr:recombinase family protein [Clostridia bacterium]
MVNIPRAVTVIPATINLRTNDTKNKQIKRKVAAYARVSTDSEEQLSSYEAQVDYYTRYIQSKNNWEFVEVYTDEGISATNTKRRDGFKRMIKDALDKKIDLIITKSVSRFARNTVDTLTTVRKLKEKGVEVYFEKENIYTLDSKGELLITIMSSLAQEESRSISENVTWGQRKRFADGKVNLPYKHFLGYEKGEDGVPKLVEKEAKIVRLIYRLFLEGKSASAIAHYLTKEEIPTPGGKSEWCLSTVRSILRNEKYKGDALLQKFYTVDFLTKKKKKNEGEIPQYYVRNSHEAIISPEVYDMVQEEIQKRKNERSNHSSVNCFSSKIVCGECGSYYGSKVWHSNDKYRKVVWQCNDKFKNKRKCRTCHLTEEQIKKEFVKAFNNLIENKEEVIKDAEGTILSLTDTKDIDNQISNLKKEMDVIVGLMRSLVHQNSRKAINQDEYNRKYDAYNEKYDELKNVLFRLEEKKQDLKVRRDKIKVFIDNLRGFDEVISEFDERLWNTMVEKLIIKEDDTKEFIFKN